VEGSGRPKKFIEIYEAFLEFPEGWEGAKKIPSMGEVWIFSRTTRYKLTFN